MVEFDSETLFNGAAAFVATLAVLFFVGNVEQGLSPVTKAGITVAFLAGVFALTQRTGDAQLTLLGYAVVVVGVLAQFFEFVGTFDVGDGVTVLGLLVVAAALFALRSRLDEDNHFVDGTTATYAAGAVAAVVALVLVVDVATGGLAYELQPESQVTFAESEADRETVRIATVVATNPTPLPERVEAPRYRACAAGNWSTFGPPPGADPEAAEHERVHVDVHVEDGYGEHVFGFGEKRYPVQLHLRGADVRGETVPVQVTEECPGEQTGAPYLALFPAELQGGPTAD